MNAVFIILCVLSALVALYVAFTMYENFKFKKTLKRVGNYFFTTAATNIYNFTALQASMKYYQDFIKETIKLHKEEVLSPSKEILDFEKAIEADSSTLDNLDEYISTYIENIMVYQDLIEKALPGTTKKVLERLRKESKDGPK